MSFIKGIITSKPVLIIEIGIILFFAFKVGKAVLERRALESEVSALEAEIGRLEQNESALGALLEYVKTDTFVETEARRQLNLAKEGEHLLVVPTVDDLPRAGGSTTEPARLADLFTPTALEERRELPSNLVRWWQYFFEPDLH